MNTRTTFTTRLYALASALGVALCSSPAAFGQSAEETSEGERLEEIIVTGTRIQRDGYQSPNAISVVTSDDMATLGVDTIAGMMRQMPNNIGSVTPETVGDGPFNLGGTIANLRGLNTASGTRTLTLVDSRRVVATNDGGAVDLNVIPSALVGRMETVTGGASATYGADALAGVVNVILDTDIDGVKLNANWGQTGEGDGDQGNMSIAAGTDLFNDRGHVTVAYERSFQDPIRDCTTRDYCRESRGLITNGTAVQIVPTPFGVFEFPLPPYSVRNSDVDFPGQPQSIVTEGMRYAVLSTGNVMDDPFGTGDFFTFNEAGNDVVPIWTDLTPSEINAIMEANSFGESPVPFLGEGFDLAYDGVPVLPDITRDTLHTAFRYELESGIELEAEVSYAAIDTTALQNSHRQMNFLAEVREDNYFLLQGSPQLQQVLTDRLDGTECTPRPFIGDASVECYTIDKVWNDQLDRVNNTETDTGRIVLSANGPLFGEGGSWTWDTYFSYGNTERAQEIQDWATQTRYDMAVDAVEGPDGQPICRANHPGQIGADDRALWRAFYLEALGDTAEVAEADRFVNTLRAGCVPLNPMGFAASEAALDYAWPTILTIADITDKAVSVTFSGDFWRGVGAGPFRMAAGVDTRESTTKSSVAGDDVTSSDYLVPFGGLWSGRTTDISPFAEVDLPLLSDLPGAEYLMTNLAYRTTRNKAERLGLRPVESTRDVSSWKVSMVWQPMDLMRFRLTRSSDVRAPSAQELYQETTPGIGNLFGATTNTASNPFRGPDDPLTPADEQDDDYRSQTGGNAGLNEEQSVSETFGIVFSPGGRFDGLQASVDYYETTIVGGITGVGAQGTLDRCFDEVTTGVPEGEQIFCPNITFGAPTIPGNPFSNIDTIASSEINSEPFFSRGIDYSISYFKPLSDGGSLNFRLLATRFLEQEVDLGGDFGRRNVSGQAGSNGLGGGFFGGVGVDYAPTPDLQSNFWVTYAKNAFAVTTQIRHVSSGRLSNQFGWIGPGEAGFRVNDAGEVEGPFPYSPDISNTIANPTVPSWTTANLHFNYDFTRSRFSSDRFEALSAYLHIDNVADKMPSVFSGTGPGGINTTYYSGLGRQIEVGMSMEF